MSLFSRFALLSLMLFSACSSENKSEQEISELKLEVSQLKNEIEDLRDKVKSRRKEPLAKNEIETNNIETSPNSAIIPTTLVPNGSHLDDPFLGPKDADVVIMAFIDYQCRPCRSFMNKTFPKLKENYIDNDKVRYILRDFPLASNPAAPRAAKTAHCAGEQGQYWAMHNALFEHQIEVDERRFSTVADKIAALDAEKLERCIISDRYEKELAADIEEGQLLGVKGAPAFFVGTKNDDDSYKGIFIRGAQPYAVFDQYLQKLLG